jgi:hypothetical protein
MGEREQRTAHLEHPAGRPQYRGFTALRDAGEFGERGGSLILVNAAEHMGMAARDQTLGELRLG